MAKEFLEVSEIFERVDDQRRDDGDTPVDINKKYRALNGILSIISSRASWRFAVRKKMIAYYEGLNSYHFQNQLTLDDFKEIKDLRPHNWTGVPIEYIEADEFMSKLGARFGLHHMAVDYQDGYPTMLIGYGNMTKPQVYLDTLTGISDNGTWAVDGTTDAINLRQDTGYYRYGGSALAFDVDVSVGAGNAATIQNSTLATVDYTDHNGLSHGFLEIYLPAALAATLTSIQLKWGSSAANYYSKTVTSPADGNAWKEGWNIVEFAWDSATTTGTPDASLISYSAITLNYTAPTADAVGVRVSKLFFSQPEFMDLSYYSEWLVIDGTTGARKRLVTSDQDKILIPTDHVETVVEGLLWQVMDQMGTDNGDDSARHFKLFQYGYDSDPSKNPRIKRGGMALMVRDFAVRTGSARRKVRVYPAVQDD